MTKEGRTPAVKPDVDLRDQWPSVRDQKSRGTCLACAASDCHEHAQASGALSAEFLFYHAVQAMPDKNPDHGITLATARQALIAHGQPVEAEWPYQLTQPSPWTPPKVTKLWHGDLRVGSADASAISKLIKLGNPVIVGLQLTTDFVGLIASPFVIPATGSGFGGHAVLGIGCGLLSGVEHLLIRNSWGVKWADQGHAWLPLQYLADKLIGYAVIAKQGP